MRPAPPLDHLLALTDDTGVAQHATFAVVARAHGYCLDDNARALALTASLRRLGFHPREEQRLFTCTAAFVQHAFDEDRGRFRNFMDFDRRWLEPEGSEDSHGRAIAALGAVAGDVDPDRRFWAWSLLDRAAPVLERFTSPRALACGLRGLVAARSAGWPGHGGLGDRLAGRLCDHLRDSRAPGWTWFEEELSYGNATLPEALIHAGIVSRRPDWEAAGLATLGWLCGEQTAPDGHFRPVGSDGFWRRGEARAVFDQQPIEASTTVAATLAAWHATGERAWLEEAERAFAWFEGANDLGTALAIPHTGGCRDGLHPERVNMNQGAESTLAWLQAALDMIEAERTSPRTGRLRETTGRAASTPSP